MKVIVTGSRHWSDESAVYGSLNKLFNEHGPLHVVHGACSTGADAMAHHWMDVVGLFIGCTETPFPADWERLGRAAGPARNAEMVSAGADLVLAFPHPLPQGRATWNTIHVARKAGIPVRIWGSNG